MSMPLWADLEDEPDYDPYSGDTEELLAFPTEADERRVEKEEYYLWHNDAYQQGHPELYPEVFESDEFDGRDSDLGGM